MSRSPSQIIESKGGAAVVGVAVGQPSGVVRMWKHRNHIPRTAWPELMEAFPDLTIEVLKDAEALAGQERRTDAGPRHGASA